MSGGSYNNEWLSVESEYCNRMYDSQLNAMMDDLVKVLHDLEWWKSDDISEEDYRETANKFKKKWFNQTKEDYKQIIIDEFEKKKQQMLKELGL